MPVHPLMYLLTAFLKIDEVKIESSLILEHSKNRTSHLENRF